MNGKETALTLRLAGELTRRQFFAMVALFWLYVTLSNILYAYSMRTGISKHDRCAPVCALAGARYCSTCCCCPSAGLVLGFAANPVAPAAGGGARCK